MQPLQGKHYSSQRHDLDVQSFSFVLEGSLWSKISASRGVLKKKTDIDEIVIRNKEKTLFISMS